MITRCGGLRLLLTLPPLAAVFLWPSISQAQGTSRAAAGVCYVDGTHNPTLAAAVTCAGSSGVIEIPIFAAPTLTGNVTIPVGVILKFDGPSGITTTGFTLTINGPLVAPHTQIFFGSGTVVLPNPPPVDPIWFPGADLGARVAAAMAACPANGCIIDARGEADPVTWSSQVTFTKPFKLLTPKGIVGFTGTLPAITVTVPNAAGWSIEGVNPGWSNGGVTASTFTPSGHGNVLQILNSNQNFTISGIAFDYGVASGNVASNNANDKAITFNTNNSTLAFRGHFYHISCIFCYDVIFDGPFSGTYNLTATNSNVMEFVDVYGQALGDSVLQFISTEGLPTVHDQMRVVQSGCNGYKALGTFNSSSACIRFSNSNNVTMDEPFFWHGNDASAGTSGAPVGFFGIEVDSGQTIIHSSDSEANFFNGSGSGGIFVNGGQASVFNPTSRSDKFGNASLPGTYYQADLYTAGGATVLVSTPSFPNTGGSADTCVSSAATVYNSGIASTNASDVIFLLGPSSIDAPSGTNCSPNNVFTLGGKIIGITNQTGFMSLGGNVMSLVSFPANTGAALTIPALSVAQSWTAIQNYPSNTVALSADWSCGTGGAVSSCTSATIIGSGGGVPLTFTLPLAAQSYTMECDGVVGQATAVTANNWNFLTATNGATNVTAFYDMYTAATAKAAGATTDQVSTTTTFNIGPAWTLGGTGTKMPFHIYARIEGASASGTVVSLQLVAPTVADLVTIYRGAGCRIF